MSKNDLERMQTKAKKIKCNVVYGKGTKSSINDLRRVARRVKKLEHKKELKKLIEESSEES